VTVLEGIRVNTARSLLNPVIWILAKMVLVAVT